MELTRQSVGFLNLSSVSKIFLDLLSLFSSSTRVKTMEMFKSGSTHVVSAVGVIKNDTNSSKSASDVFLLLFFFEDTWLIVGNRKMVKT